MPIRGMETTITSPAIDRCCSHDDARDGDDDDDNNHETMQVITAVMIFFATARRRCLESHIGCRLFHFDKFQESR